MIFAVILIALLLLITFISSKETLPDEIETSFFTKPFYKSGCYIYRLLFSSRTNKYLEKIRTTNFILQPGGQTNRSTAIYFVKKIGICLIILFFGLLIILINDLNSAEEKEILDGNKVIRSDYNEKPRHLFLSFEADGEIYPNCELTLNQRLYTDDQLDAMLPEFEEALENIFLNKNESLDFINNDVSLPEKIDEYPFDISYSISNRKVINLDGVLSDNINPDGEIISIEATITYYDYSVIYIFNAQVFPKEYSKTEYIYKQVMDAITNADEDSRYDEYMVLPDEINGIKVIWSEEKTTNTIVLVFAVIIISIFIFVAMDKDLYKKVEKRSEQMLEDYPEIVSKLTLLIGAGMTVRGAWKKICNEYKEKKENHFPIRFAYEEMLYTSYEMESGVEESTCYNHFSERSHVQKYIKLAALLNQSLKTGSSKMISSLNEECQDAFEDRKNQAEKKGEEAGTKLLAPMMLMLLVVMVIIMVPAFTSM